MSGTVVHLPIVRIDRPSAPEAGAHILVALDLARFRHLERWAHLYGVSVQQAATYLLVEAIDQRVEAGR